ncbi:MAG: MbnH family di-heme enzyme [Pseudomonadota bacterium]
MIIRLLLPLTFIGASVLIALCNRPVAAPYEWDLPAGFPQPTVPDDNPMSRAKVELGRHLFYDPRLSLTGMISCASCHQQAFAFSDPAVRSSGATGQETKRNSMTLVNVAYNASYDWANPYVTTLEHQMLTPLFGDDPIEMGLANRRDQVMQALREDTRYQRMFAAAFGFDADIWDWQNIIRAIASFSRTIISGDSPYDRYLRGEQDALSDAALRGLDLFVSERLECFHCHGGFNFTDSSTHDKLNNPPRQFHNTGLYNVGADNRYPRNSEGVFELTRQTADMGRFKAPTLRNILRTAPYMHDGSAVDIDAAIDHYVAGGRLTEQGAAAGDGRLHPQKSEFVTGFELTESERADLIAFFASLNDEKLFTRSDLADPWANLPRATKAP